MPDPLVLYEVRETVAMSAPETAPGPAISRGSLNVRPASPLTGQSSGTSYRPTFAIVLVESGYVDFAW